jgi:hypothetical protein
MITRKKKYDPSDYLDFCFSLSNSKAHLTSKTLKKFDKVYLIKREGDVENHPRQGLEHGGKEA